MRQGLRLLTWMALSLAAERASAAPYIGVTVGFSDPDLLGPYSPPNIPLFNPVSGQDVPTWDDWVEEAAAAGVDYMAPDQRGYMPVETAGDPHHMVDLVNVLKNRGLDGKIKLAIFDDNAASWTAQWNAANGRGFGYAEPFDISDQANWAFIWDYNYKIFYESVPDANRFKIDGRPVIIIWSLSPTFVANPNGNASLMLAWLRQQAQTTFGFNPYIVASSDWLVHDPTSADEVDATQAWFIPQFSPGSYSVSTFNGNTIGVAVPSFQSLLAPDHGSLLQTGLTATYQGGAELTLIEGFTDWEEHCALFRVANLDPTGAAQTYDDTGYDYPSQRLNVVRDFSSAPFPIDFKAEAEGADAFGGGMAGPQVNYYRNGDIDIEPTTDVDAGYDVANVQTGEWLEWERIPLQGGGVHLTVRVASSAGGGKLHFVVDGQSYPSVDVPHTGGPQTWTTMDTGVQTYSSSVYHVVRLVADTGGFNVNYWQVSTDVGFRSGFEAMEPQPTWTNSTETQAPGGQENVTGATCAPVAGVAHFESSLEVSGTAVGGGTSTYAYRVFDLSSSPVVLDDESSLSYFMNPQNDNGRYVAVDLHFTDGTFLGQAGLHDQNGQPTDAASGHGGSIPLSLFSLITTDLSSLAGKAVDRVDVVFSRANAQGGYLAYVDDILVTSGTKSASATTDAGLEDASGGESGASTGSPDAAMEAAPMEPAGGAVPVNAGASAGCGCELAGGHRGRDFAGCMFAMLVALVATRRKGQRSTGPSAQARR